MKKVYNFVGGLAGAIALNIVHETVKRLDHDAPRINLVGEEAITKAMKSAGKKPLKGGALFGAALAGDLLSNALYYATIGAGNKKLIVVRGIGAGLGAGIGAVLLTKPLGLSDAPVNRTLKTRILTISYYTFGGLVAALSIKALHKKELK